jgi:hypothetical protein
MKQQGIAFSATLYQAKTDPAGGWKVTFDVPESDAQSILQLAQLRDTVLSIGVIHDDSLKMEYEAI